MTSSCPDLKKNPDLARCFRPSERFTKTLVRIRIVIQNIDKEVGYASWNMSEKGMIILDVEEAGLIDNQKLQTCEFICASIGCYRKTKAVSFSKAIHQTKGTLDYLHADCWGPSRVPSLGGARYFLSIIDDFSRMTWVFMMKHKSEAFEKFKHWKILIENQTGRKIKRLQLPQAPATAIDCKTPIEVWTGKPADYSKLRVFGCPAYYHVSDGKLNPRANKGIFMGYGDGVKGYRIWSPMKRRVHSIQISVRGGSLEPAATYQELLTSKDSDMWSVGYGFKIESLHMKQYNGAWETS
ncbi:retrotransposon protein, putative, ty1-copia subclass [Tanacetum coccineum]